MQNPTYRNEEYSNHSGYQMLMTIDNVILCSVGVCAGEKSYTYNKCVNCYLAIWDENISAFEQSTGGHWPWVRVRTTVRTLLMSVCAVLQTIKLNLFLSPSTAHRNGTSTHRRLSLILGALTRAMRLSLNKCTKRVG